MTAPTHRRIILTGLAISAGLFIFSSSGSSSQPEFSIGLITDVQYADVEDGTGFGGRDRRYFRGSLEVLSAAMDYFIIRRPTLVAQLGDLIDGRNVKSGTSEAAFSRALTVLRRAPCRVLSLVGNHDLYNYDRATLAKRLSTAPDGGREFYSFTPVAGWRVVVLDALQESILGVPEGDVRRRRAERWLAEHNPNDLSDGGAWFHGLKGHARRSVPFNGALGREQLLWLRRTLRSASSAAERVVVLSHVVLAPQACDGTTMAWDYDSALSLLRERHTDETQPVVALVLCGHDHHGGYHRDDSGIHHLTLRSPLNSGAAGRAFALLEMHAKHLLLRGPKLADVLPRSDRWALANRPPTLTLDDGEETMRLAF